ncbi:CS-domain-containing protein [Coprinopsis marcescibilis]|uniref:CS-domain-containing protein n=1 Tax=Coprinopsis marcescibilis TaxID=230819 RepID=A0A5C3LAU9_COPMA|nr:CS-domain-containing protein [Coprinopsis marcescibilis]
MPHCARKGCNKTFSEDTNTEVCTFHPGAPVFHEGLKSWSCCKDTNKPVLDFDEFMGIPGCTETDGHTSAVSEPQPAQDPAQKAQVSKPAPVASTINHVVDGLETFSITPQKVEAPAAALPIIEDEDDLDARVEPGTQCKRRGCGVTFVSDEVNRIGNGEGTVCVYHPMSPLFREGSKGYLCCKPKVLEFDEFLKIKGCKIGRHCFVPKIVESNDEQLVECRIDHYQTLDKVQVSVFAKKVDKESSTVTIDSDKITLDLRLPGNKRFTRTVELFGPIVPDKSSYMVLGTKVELSLQKKDNRSWTVLEKTDRDLGGISLTFGVSGRTGTVGAKEVVLDESNRTRSEGL